MKVSPAAMAEFVAAFCEPAISPDAVARALAHLEALGPADLAAAPQHDLGPPREVLGRSYRLPFEGGWITVDVTSNPTLSVWAEGLHGWYVPRALWPAWLAEWLEAATAPGRQEE